MQGSFSSLTATKSESDNKYATAGEPAVFVCKKITGDTKSSVEIKYFVIRHIQNFLKKDYFVGI